VFKFPFNYQCSTCSCDFKLTNGETHICPRCNSPNIEYQDKLFLKRCIGLPGEIAEIRGRGIYINDRLIIEPEIIKLAGYKNIPMSRGPYGHLGQQIKVPKNHYFVLSDNSKDSRFWGFVPSENILGKAFKRYWPPKRIGSI
jgi:signal peptidase I